MAHRIRDQLIVDVTKMVDKSWVLSTGMRKSGTAGLSNPEISRSRYLSVWRLSGAVLHRLRHQQPSLRARTVSLQPVSFNRAQDAIILRRSSHIRRSFCMPLTYPARRREQGVPRSRLRRHGEYCQHLTRIRLVGLWHEALFER